ncbi:MAG: reverse transcriptase domain-containing protein, partial [Candidatus Phytoplasma australasiaticum]|nr:reverse transcriptase domain-containing protein [Candidatus Phytoplasma australasiaticum]
KLTKALLSFKFQQTQHDHSLFVKKETERVAVVLVYVDDMLITGDSLKLIQHTKATLQETFKKKDLEELKYFLGIEFARSEKGTIMHQRKYKLQLISETALGAAKPAMTHIDTNIKLTSREYDDHLSEGNGQTED